MGAPRGEEGEGRNPVRRRDSENGSHQGRGRGQGAEVGEGPRGAGGGGRRPLTPPLTLK